MPDNQTTERDPDVVSYTAWTGLRNEVTPERFDQGDLAVADNIDIDQSGRIARRDGFTLQIAGPAHSIWSDREQSVCFFAQGNVLYSLNETLVPSQVTALQAATQLSFEKVNDRTYFTNGVDTGVIEQGAARSWGVVPPTLPGVNVSVGSLTCGTYQFTMTYVRDDGQESGAPMAAIVQVEADGAGLDFFGIPSSTDPTVVAKNIYLSPPNGEQMFLALVIANAQATASYTNDATELTVPLESEFLVPAPAGQIVAYYRGRMWVAVGNVLCPSQPFDYERFDLRDYLQLDGRITLLAAVTDKELTEAARSSGFFIGTDKSCGVLVGSNPEDFQYVPKTSYGAIPGCLTFVDGSLFQDGSAGARELPMWLTSLGVCVGMIDMTIKNLTRTRYSFPVGNQGAAVYLPEPNRFIATSTN